MSYRLIYITLCLIILTGCGRKKQLPQPVCDFLEILKKGTIHVGILPGSMSYFVYKGEPMGYEYDLLQNFSEQHRLKIDLKVAENEKRLYEMLDSCHIDLIAYNLPVTNEGKSRYLYCGREVINTQILVQRSNKNDTLLKDVPELIGKEVWVIHDSKYHYRLVNLNDEIGGGIHVRIIERDTIITEDLIAMVSSGEIPYTLSNFDLAKLNKTYYPNIDISLKISHPQYSSWMVRKNMPELASALNNWFEENENKPYYRRIVKQYFEMSKMPGDAPAPILSETQISHHDSLFQKYAVLINLDWRLLASIAYQESKFHTDRISWAGATGLMGLMPRTAKAFGIPSKELNDPETSIRGATALMNRLNTIFREINDKDERIKFVLAAYNAGSGHIHDARALAKKYGKNPDIWKDNVEECLKWKKLPEYYNDPVCKQGYFHDKETVNYVESVMERWNYYQSKVKK